MDSMPNLYDVVHTHFSSPPLGVHEKRDFPPESSNVDTYLNKIQLTNRPTMFVDVCLIGKVLLNG